MTAFPLAKHRGNGWHLCHRSVASGYAIVAFSKKMADGREARLLERRERKRVRDRRAKQAARERLLAESAALQASIVEMTATLEALRLRSQRPCLLPWTQVALSLEVARSHSASLTNSLQRHVAAQTKLAQALYTWLESMPRAPSGLAAWRDVRLPLDDDVRRVGYDWIAAQMLHTTDHHVAPEAFPHANDDFISASWGLEGGKVFTQFVLDGSVDEVVTAAWAFSQALPTILNATRGGVTNVFHNKAPTREVCYNREAFPTITTNGFYTAFRRAHDVVMHYRTVRHDDAFPILGPTLEHDIQEWNVIRAISPSQCILRAVDIYQPCLAYESMEAYTLDTRPYLLEDAQALRHLDLEDALVNVWAKNTSSRLEGMLRRMKKLLRHVQANPAAFPSPF
ncbi:hypothetical protein ACHHYP_13107 [Achlya hypogyna]|uniref:BZIP domain-containing protein n=1 Tax=Achlya hypogyna TaxID=1202772 RepID=A0A1V9YG43_ACHHY|nr:hypothetical protein ACHHYP_13107 [Achlya hypogyna]